MQCTTARRHRKNERMQTFISSCSITDNFKGIILKLVQKFIPGDQFNVTKLHIIGDFNRTIINTNDQ